MSIRHFSGENLSRARASWKGIAYELSRSRIGPRAEAVAHLPRHALFVTLNGGTRRTIIEMDGAPRYDGADVPGVVSFVPANCRRRGWYSGDTFEIATILLDPETVAAVAGSAVTVDGIDFFPVANGHDPFVHQAALTLREEMNGGGALGSLFAETVAATLALHLLRRYSSLAPARRAEAPGAAPERLRRVVEYIHDNLATDTSLATFAALAGMSEDHFGRTFRRAFGTPPHRYVIERRLDRAKDLLATSDLPLSEIAYTLGFSSQSHFSTVFRRFLATTPRAYRERHGVAIGRRQPAAERNDDATPET